MLQDFGLENPQKQDIVSQAISLLEKYHYGQRPFFRDCFDDGHFTAGVIPLSSDMSRVLLMRSKKYGTWQQFGGHTDGEMQLRNSALREFVEESGIPEHAVKISNNISTIDIHEVPEMDHPKYGYEPAHYHYDINFIAFLAPSYAPKVQDEDVLDIEWFSISDIDRNSTEFASGLLSMIETIFGAGKK